MSNPKCGAIVLILAVLLWAMGDFFVYSADSDCLTLSLEAWDLGDGCMEVFLVGSEARFCGALAEIGYSEGLSLLSVEKCEPIASGSLTFSESNGRIRLLIDHFENLDAGGRLVRLLFACDAEICESVFFTVGGNGAYAFSESGELVPLVLIAEEASLRIGLHVAEEERFPVLLRERTESGTALFFHAPAWEGCFAVGVEVCVVELSTGSLDRYAFHGVTRCDGVFVSPVLILSQKGRFCVIVRLLGLTRDGIRKGGERIYYFVDGALYG